MSVLNFNDIKNMISNNLVEVQLEDMPGSSIYMRPMSAKANIEASAMAQDVDNAEKILMLKKVVLQSVLCDEKGVLMFDMNTIDDLFNLDCKIVYQLYNKAVEINFPQPKVIEDIAKN